MNTLDTLFRRKSIRSYTGESISEEQLQLIIKAANAAPIARGIYQNVHLTVVTNPDLLHRIDRAGAEVMPIPGSIPLYHAPMFIMVSAKGNPELDNPLYSNAAIVVQNMAIAATELGVGSCHIWGAVRGLNKKPDLVRELNLPEGYIPACGIILGVTEEKYEEREIDVNRISLNTIK